MTEVIGQEDRPPKSALIQLLEESLAAYNPNDANYQVLDYFMSKPAGGATTSSSSSAMEFSSVTRERNAWSEAWTKSVLKSQAFASRKKENNQPQNQAENKPGPTFVEDFVQEMSKNNKDIAKLSDLSQKLMKTETAVDLVASGSRTAMLTLGAELLVASEETFGNSAANDQDDGGFTCDDYALMLARHTFKGAKKTWANRKATKTSSNNNSLGSTASFMPFSPSFIPLSEVVHGFMDLKQQQHPHAPSSSSSRSTKTGTTGVLTPASLTIVGVKVAANQPSGQMRGWSSYGFLSAASVVMPSRSRCPLNIFPQPVAVDRVASGDLMFVFESQVVSPVFPFVGPAFARSLRKHPVLLLAWCRQFAAATVACSMHGVCFARNMQITDLFIREHGLLSLLHLSVSKDVSEDSERHIVGENTGRTAMIAFVAHALTVMLALSRRHDAIMKHATINETGEGVQKKPLKDEASFTLVDGSSVSRGDVEVVTITQGCSLDIAFCSPTGGDARRRVVMRRIGDKSSAATDNDADDEVVYVDIADDANVALFGINGQTDVYSVLRVTGMRPGDLLLSASAVEVYPISHAPTVVPSHHKGQHRQSRSRSPTKSNESGRNASRSRSPSGKEGKSRNSSSALTSSAGGVTLRKSKASCILRIIVIPSEPVRSLPAIELITLLEASRTANKPLFMNARCLRPQSVHDPFTEDDELAAYKEWTVVKGDLFKNEE